MATALPFTYDHLHCPICSELPEEEVYQCQSGHPICAKCFKHVLICPQCQQLYPEVPIRCRVLEEMLELAKITTDCPYEHEGCDKKICKGEIEEHKLTCTYRPVSICNWMALRACNFESSHPGRFVKHLEEFHEAKRQSHIQWPQFMKNFHELKKSFASLHIYDTSVGHWGGLFDTEYFVTFVKCSYDDQDHGYMTCVALVLDENSKPGSKYTVDMSLETSKHDVICKWSGVPTFYKDAEQDITDPPFRTPLNHIVNFVKHSNEPDIDLHLNVIIKRTNSSSWW